MFKRIVQGLITVAVLVTTVTFCFSQYATLEAIVYCPPDWEKNSYTSGKIDAERVGFCLGKLTWYTQGFAAEFNCGEMWGVECQQNQY